MTVCNVLVVYSKMRGIHDEDLQRLKCFSVRFGLQRSRAAATQTHVALRLARNVLEEEAVGPENSSSQAELRLALLERADEQALLSSNCLASRNNVCRNKRWVTGRT